MIKLYQESVEMPGINCLVTRKKKHNGQRGVVVGHRGEGENVQIRVAWGSSRIAEWHTMEELRNGFRSGDIVQDCPRSNVRKPLGTGTVLNHRRLASRDQVLVEIHRTGESRWLPYEHLVRIRDARLKFKRANGLKSDSAERFRLKILAYTLESWNQMTGALGRFDVDPLPHQIDLVHRIMSSDQANWLIADDVGLGKTIEVGLLLAAMKRRRQARRVLVICPSGLVRQWQDEMRYKFHEDFEIYGPGNDFNINHVSQWVGRDKVIASIDLAKIENHKLKFKDAGDWDIIVFDEAHRLSKKEHQATTQRYLLAQALQPLTDSLIFLTGTPHQGDTLQFFNLLSLLRPDLRRRFANIFLDQAVVSEVVLRNQKSQVTDAKGEFLFRGQDTRLVGVPLSDDAREFNKRLQSYLRYGYDAARVGGDTGRAIGFVMTVYRKLTSSSIVAIEAALRRRMERLDGSKTTHQPTPLGPDFSDWADAFQDGTDGRDDIADIADTLMTPSTMSTPFFSDERARIESLLDIADNVRQNDLKMQEFISAIVRPLLEERKKLLIFTEYRATQQHLIETLKSQFPSCAVSQINGSMSLNEKHDNIASFNDDAQFMVSTEAGGEGINLHERCHVLVNYDLPWNPTRLVQRSGRLYRYGQQERVIVFNLMVDDGFDSRALGLMLDRVHSIAHDMASVSSEYQEGLQTEILGELLERIDLASILADNKDMDISHTDEEIEDAIERAKEARRQQKKLFSKIEGYDPNTTVLHEFGPEEIRAFLEGILPHKEVKVRGRRYAGRVLELQLPEEMRGRFSEFPEGATVVDITVDRQLAVRNPKLVPMDFASPFFLELIEFAKSPEFDGEYARIAGPEAGSLALYKLRWQNDQGRPRWETVIPIFLSTNSKSALANPGFFGSLLLGSPEAPLEEFAINPEERAERINRLDARADYELERRCSAFRHPNGVNLLATADIVPTQL